MAKCEQGYLCDVCGQDVAEITDSDLYLRYVMGQVRPDELHRTRERHIRCNTTVAQFIVDPTFEPVRVEGPFAKEHLQPAYVAEQEELVTRAWRRLQEIPGLHIHLIEYPLPEVRERWRREAEAQAAKRQCKNS
ncbi:MAG: hypothetical protein HY000_27160 [Planctomycetes bacterium]|nr:hypothetical protein [Planctomycetota bacterium]